MYQRMTGNCDTNLLLNGTKIKDICIIVTGSWWGNRRERDQWGDLALDGWIILGWISGRWDVGIWTGLGWPRLETGGVRL